MLEDEKVIVCDKCEHEFRLKSVDIKETKVNCQGAELKLMFFTCPKCNEIYKVCLKDSWYNTLLKDLEKNEKEDTKKFW